MQVLYNTFFHGHVQWWLELTYAHSVATGNVEPWTDPEWMMLGMGGYGSGARFVLELAINKGNATLAEWALAHGAGPNAAPPARARKAAGRAAGSRRAASIRKRSVRVRTTSHSCCSATAHRLYSHRSTMKMHLSRPPYDSIARPLAR